MNTDDLAHAICRAEQRVLEIQAKLHRWARDDPHRRFGDLFNLVADPAFLLLAWDQVRGNKGARTAGVDGRTAASISLGAGRREFLAGLRTSLRNRSFVPMPVRERMIPKAGGKLRRLGIATITGRVVQASLKLVLEPIFEGDIKACFDEISHVALMKRVRARVGDKRVLAMVKAFLKSGILGEDRVLRENNTGTPQGSILSPLLSNVALSVLDEHIALGPGGPAASQTERAKRRRHCLPNYRLVRYADDWCLMVTGTKDDAHALKEEIAGVLSTMGLRLSPEKTLISRIDEGLDFLGWHIQRHRKRGSSRQYACTYPSRKAVKAVTGKVKTICRTTGTNLPLDALLLRLNPALQGWCAYFRPGVSARAFSYLGYYAWQQVGRWLRRKHHRAAWKDLRRLYYKGSAWWPASENRKLFSPANVGTTLTGGRSPARPRSRSRSRSRRSWKRSPGPGRS